MPQTWKPNVTVAAIIERDGRFLMVEEETSDGLRLNQPAGHLDPDETLPQGCAREAQEESAWRVEPISVLGLYMSRYFSERTQQEVTYLRCAFICQPIEPTHTPLDIGIVRALWLTADEIRQSITPHRSDLVMRCIEDYQALQKAGLPGYPLSMLYHHPSMLQRSQSS